ncbi:hypothetical protein RclHR1_14070008 [Rhizophagus clarus]|uniref:Colicin D/E5 nuclease n=1 Tax=Rhizophagus clarus TaxID=94130 RepID=A0A2Z6QS94_9GLOM|nr:hypothetical protein RclHR1_14070008 [Rhizophagus clarus]GES79350.1 colicin D/E5 nuclease [Rhizophagus clarus]
MGEDQQNNQNIHIQRIMNELEEREICYLKCVIKKGRLEFEWSIITPSTWDWIGLYENNSKENTNWLNRYWFYIANHSHREILTDGRYSFTGSHWIGTISDQNQISLVYIMSKMGCNTYLIITKPIGGFDQDDNWNNQNRKKLLETLQEFTDRNTNDVNVYLGTYRNQGAYYVVDRTTHQYLIIYRGGEKDYSLCSGWVLDDDQYKYVTAPPYRLRATILLMYKDILKQIANSEGEREDLIKEYFKIHSKDKNTYGEKVYFKIAEFFSLAESYIPLSFEGRDEITPEDDYYKLDFEKVREKARTILGELEKITF